MKIAITTPTGKVGSQVAQALVAKGGHEITLLARDPAKVKDLTARGARAVKTDLEDRAQAIAGFKGADVAFLVAPPKFDAPDLRAYQNVIGDNFAAAVTANKLKRVVFMSSIGAQHGDGTGPITGLHDIELKLNAAIKQTGGSVFHLRPTFFQENWFMYVPTIKAQGAAYGPIAPETRFPMIATADIAKVACEVLLDSKWSGINVRELLGPRDYSFAEAARIIGEAVGKPVNFVQVPVDQARQAMLSMGLGSSIVEKYLEMYAGIQNGRVSSEQGRSPQTTTPTKLEDFARTALAPAIRG